MCQPQPRAVERRGGSGEACHRLARRRQKARDRQIVPTAGGLFEQGRAYPRPGSRTGSCRCSAGREWSGSPGRTEPSGGRGSGVRRRTFSASSARGSVLGKSEATCPSPPMPSQASAKCGGTLSGVSAVTCAPGRFQQRADAADIAGGMILRNQPVVPRPDGHARPVERHGGQLLEYRKGGRAPGHGDGNIAIRRRKRGLEPPVEPQGNRAVIRAGEDFRTIHGISLTDRRLTERPPRHCRGGPAVQDPKGPARSGGNPCAGCPVAAGRLREVTFR